MVDGLFIVTLSPVLTGNSEAPQAVEVTFFPQTINQICRGPRTPSSLGYLGTWPHRTSSEVQRGKG